MRKFVALINRKSASKRHIISNINSWKRKLSKRLATLDESERATVVQVMRLLQPLFTHVKDNQPRE